MIPASSSAADMEVADLYNPKMEIHMEKQVDQAKATGGLYRARRIYTYIYICKYVYIYIDEQRTKLLVWAPSRFTYSGTCWRGPSRFY